MPLKNYFSQKPTNLHPCSLFGQNMTYFPGNKPAKYVLSSYNKIRPCLDGWILSMGTAQILLAVSFLELQHEVPQRLAAGLRHGIIDGSAQAADRTVPF